MSKAKYRSSDARERRVRLVLAGVLVRGSAAAPAKMIAKKPPPSNGGGNVLQVLLEERDRR